MLEARLYARVSNDEQVKYGHSIDAQITALKKYCNENDIKINGIYKDEGISAATVKKRKSYQQMIEEAKENEVILFTKLDRFSRNLLEANIEVKKLEQKNISIKAIHEDDIDTSTADGRFIFNLKLSLAEREREKTSERIRDVFKYQIQQGKSVSRSVPFGYVVENKRYVIDQEKAEALNYAFDNVILYSSASYSFKLFIEKYPSYPVNFRSFRYWLSNEIYLGKHKYNTHFCEPIISKEKFDKVQVILKNKNLGERSEKATFIFSKLIVCQCGRKMVGNKHQDKKMKNPIYQYRCNKAYQDRQCSNRHCFNEKKIEKYLLDNIDELLKDYIVDVEIKEKESNKDYTKEINTIKRKLSKLKDLYLEDLIQKEDYTNKYNELKEQLERYQSITVKTENKQVTEAKKFLNINIQELYKTLDRKQKQALWHSVIEKITLDEQFNIIVTFK